MDGAEANGGDAAVDVVPVVVGKGDVELAFVFGSVAVGVADENRLPLHAIS